MSRALACAGLVMVSVWVAAAFVSPIAAQSARSQWDGVYTAPQAKRGEALYATNCAPCHSWDLKGTEIAPALAGPSFAGRWNGKPIGELLDYTWALMPQFAPGGLTRQQNADILAFMFQSGGASAGKAELPTDAERLKTLTYVAR
jgi:quinoprotein glucose dehydrogenase